MKKIRGILFSMQLTGILLVIFAISVAIATFIENDYGSFSARALVYNAKWFELLLLLLMINMGGNIFRYHYFTREKITIFIFHVAFIVILIGSALTRYVGFEGSMRIRENTAADSLVTESTFIRVTLGREGEKKQMEEKVLLTPLRKNSFLKTISYQGKNIEVSMESFIPNAAEQIVPTEGGEPLISLVALTEGGRENLYIKNNEQKYIGNIKFTFNHPAQDAVNIFYDEDGLRFSAPFPVTQMMMVTNTDTVLASQTEHFFTAKVLYSFEDVQIVMRNFYESAAVDFVSYEGDEELRFLDALKLRITDGNTEKTVTLQGANYTVGKPESIQMGGIPVTVSYGAKVIKLPFSIYLKDFELERYPGSMSPSSFASEVKVMDTKNQVEKDHRIFMNNVLKYGGYRFYQSSYDSDEQGTILSVNHDSWGTFVTYLGYILLALGMISSLLNRSTYWGYLLKITKPARSFIILGVVWAISGSHNFAQTNNEFIVSEDQAKIFGEVLVQDNGGRIKPLNTFASQISRKVTKKNVFEELNPDRLLLSMLVYPEYWQQYPMIKVSDQEIRSMLRITGNYARFTDFFDFNQQNQYILASQVQKAYEKNPAHRSNFDRELINVDERVNICYMIYSWDFLRIFPKKDDPEHMWYPPLQAEEFDNPQDSIFVRDALFGYLKVLGGNTGIDANPTEIIGAIKTFQQHNGANIIPSRDKVKLEIFYNSFNIFERLYRFYGLIGFILLIIAIIQILNAKRVYGQIIFTGLVLLIIGFVLHATGLGIRWYLSGHAPWSNAYESLIFISWATMLAGILFVKKSPITMSATAILASLILFVAHLSWMNPEITNLVPVLKSIWLTIHVSVITSSYGFLGLAAILGIINLVLYSLQNKENKTKLQDHIQRLTHVSELTMILGLYLITIGTFLGAVWANESWGRYWGWDPKETWALVTVLVYAFILHMRFIPGLKGTFTLNVASLFGYSTVLMTYFGVNYYLSGLHSYAKGDPVPVPTFIYYTIFTLVAITVFAYINNRKVNAVKK